jgi:DNA replicative helicase MCM subunit Mcm2 (Cdc46/Mcm family)
MAGVATNRTFDSIFRITGAFARLKLKNIIDTETANEAIKFIREMYLQYGQPIADIVDPKSTAYLGIAKIVKDCSLGVLTNGQGHDIEFTEAARIACQKNEKIKDYLGDNFRSNSNKRAKNLRVMFREEREYDYGRIMVVSSDCNELRLRWIPTQENRT